MLLLIIKIYANLYRSAKVIKKLASLAQLVEQRFYTAKVGGSNPSGRTTTQTGHKPVCFVVRGTLAIYQNSLWPVCEVGSPRVESNTI